MTDPHATGSRAAMIKAVVALAPKLRLSPNQTVIEAVRVRERLQDEIAAGATILIERANGERVELLLTEVEDDSDLRIAALESEMGVQAYLAECKEEEDDDDE